MDVPLLSNAELATEVQRLRTRVAELEIALATKMGETAPAPPALSYDMALALVQFDALIDTLPVGIGFLDPELRYVRVNPALARLNGRTPTEHLGHTLGDLFPKLAAQIEPTLRQILATGEAVRDLELRARIAPSMGLLHDWLMNAYPVRGPDNTVIGVGVAITDA
ncbi:MAG: PAS domain-containing protein, partial [Chloroflexales bacterium]